MDEDFYPDELDYLEKYNPTRKASQPAVQRPRRFKSDPKPRKNQAEELSQIVEATGLEGGFKISYKPAQYEEGWLLNSLRDFYDQHFIVDVLAQLKGGKEASVYRCQAHPSLTGQPLVAAKVYRPRQFRNLSNDKMYRQGRPLLTGEGRAVKRSDHRILRAVGKKTAFGVEVAHTSWLLYEYTTLQRLYEAGAAVPQPLAVSDNAILMGYLGDENRVAPTLSEIRLGKTEAKELFAQVLQNIELLLSFGLIHGDLSAYNLLYWEGKITLIDFPQVVDLHTNPQARFILERDVTRVCEYFSRQGVACEAEQLLAELWERYRDPDEDLPYSENPEDYLEE
jgi:RIO kinase 1